MNLETKPDLKLEFLRGGRVYFDTNVFIYRAEADPQWREVLDELWSMLEGGWLRAVTSELSLAETLVWPIRARNRAAQSEFARLIGPATAAESGDHKNGLTSVLVIPVGRGILLEAARLRALHALEMPDAIHAATAKIARCTHFLTADALLAQAIGARAVDLGGWKSAPGR